ncbi:helix-turn-helix domain-containing protein [Aliisedimentitalea scapharcae]|uniref:Helix-turn-helix domain-containing protein n=1 Tax=Aliisedimentitalea scapharcae TaxID=1524259 RepID=A0ABZ2XVW9_9RHOB
MPTTPQDRNISASFAKGLAVLACFDGGAPSLTLADLARLTGQDRATTRRGALTLVAQGYLRQDGRAFSLAPRVLALAGGFLQANQFGRLVQPVLNHHARHLGAEITLATLDQDRVLLLAQSTVSDGPVSYGFTVGSHLPVLHTSLGRMLLASAPDWLVDATLIAGAQVTHTPQSLRDPNAIRAQIHTAAQTAQCITCGEFEPGITGFAVPVASRGPTPLVVGSSSPDSTMNRASHQAICDLLHTCAADLKHAGVPHRP